MNIIKNKKLFIALISAFLIILIVLASFFFLNKNSNTNTNNTTSTTSTTTSLILTSTASQTPAPTYLPASTRSAYKNITIPDYVPVNQPAVIQAEDFDNGGEGVAYHDSDSGNNGGAYRQTDVDIQDTSDSDGGYNVGWVRDGEWLSYTFNVEITSYIYVFQARVANTNPDGHFHVEIDGEDKTGEISIPNTGDWQKYITVSSNVMYIPQGLHVMKIVFSTNNSDKNTSVGNLNYFSFYKKYDI